MDNEQARFILRSFRPDGADAGDPDFAEALKLAMENRELGEWLASERAFDAEFANALGTVDLPENLREDIMACLAAERGDLPQAEDTNDAAWIGALASIQPPAALRDKVIAAMDRTMNKDTVPASNISFFTRLAIPLAAAAGIALAFFLTRPASPPTVVKSQEVPIGVVETKFVQTLESPSFALEEKDGDHQVLVHHLRERKLPCPGRFPRGLEKVKGLGCRELEIGGKRGSLVCFKMGDDGIVHVVIFRRADVSGELPPKGRPAFSQDGKWATARWADGDKVFLVMSETQESKLRELF
ncbi:MAG: hypothetical protein V4819_05730 [Verrucomicrobiota bacterium]